VRDKFDVAVFSLYWWWQGARPISQYTIERKVKRSPTISYLAIMTGGHDRPFKLKSIISLATYIILVCRLMRFNLYMTMMNLLILFFYYSSPYNKKDHNKILWDRRRLKKNMTLCLWWLLGGKFNLDKTFIYEYNNIQLVWFGWL
jgi:hypothetical protein